MAKKAEKPAACPQCAGPRRGRGFTHAQDCPSRAAQPAGRSARDRGFDTTRLAGLSVEELLVVRSQLDALIAARAPELEQRIRTLQETLSAIRDRAPERT